MDRENYIGRQVELRLAVICCTVFIFNWFIALTLYSENLLNFYQFIIWIFICGSIFAFIHRAIFFLFIVLCFPYLTYLNYSIFQVISSSDKIAHFNFRSKKVIKLNKLLIASILTQCYLFFRPHFSTQFYFTKLILFAFLLINFNLIL